MTVNYQGCGMELWPNLGTSVVCLRSIQSKESEFNYENNQQDATM